MGNIGWVQLLIVLAIVVLLFGTKRLRNVGKDLGGAIKGFKDSMRDEDKAQDSSQVDDSPQLRQDESAHHKGQSSPATKSTDEHDSSKKS